MDFIMISAFIIYFCVLICIGLFFYKKDTTASHFMIGDRSVNYWVTAVATQASDMGGWIFLGLPAIVYTKGLIESWIAIGLIVGMFLTWHFVAPLLRTHSAQLDSLTLPSFFAHRFHDTSGTLQLAGALLSILFFVFYIASGLVGLSILFESAFGIPYTVGISLSILTAALYALIGGFAAIAWCDFFQGMFLLFMIVIVPIYAFLHLPHGISDILTAAQSAGKTISPIGNINTMLYAFMLAAGWGLGYFGQPHILINFMGLDDPRKMADAKRVGMTWQIIVLTASVSIGLIGIGFFNNSLADSQLVFITMATTLFHPFLAGFILCAILAATLSTIDTLILSSGSTIAQDIYKPFINPKASSVNLLWVSRVGAIAISLISLAIAWTNNASINDLVNYAWAGLGSSFGPLILMSLYSKKTTKYGALAGMIVGGLVSALWAHTGLWFPELPLVPGFLTGLTTIFIVSRLTKKQASGF